MPKGDGTGPRGKGPQTGRGLGKCGKSKRFTGNSSKNNGGLQQQGFNHSGFPGQVNNTKITSLVTDIKNKLFNK